METDQDQAEYVKIDDLDVGCRVRREEGSRTFQDASWYKKAEEVQARVKRAATDYLKSHFVGRF